MNTLLRKHRQQMSYAEIDYVEQLVHQLSGWSLNSGLIHAQRNGRTFTHEQVMNALKTGQVIEVNSNGRVLMRDSKGTCAVVSVRDLYLATVWFNHPRDTHKTLKRGEYTWRINVIDYIRGLR